MTKYNTFLFLFIAAVIAAIVFVIFYIQAIFGFVMNVKSFEEQHLEAFEFFSRIFSPAVIISGAVMACTSLAYRVVGIVCVAKSKTISDGEKALWIIGFVILGFITAIVFLAMAKGKKFVE